MSDRIVFTAMAASIARPESWSQNGQRLLVSQATSNFNSDALNVDVRTGRATLLTGHEGDVLYRNVRFGCSDHCIFAVTDRGREFAGIARIDGGTTAFLTPDRFDVDEFVVLPQRIAQAGHDRIAFIWNDRGYGRPALLHANGSWTNLSVPLGVAAALGPVTGPSFIEFSLQSPTQLEAVWRYDFRSRRARAITVGEYGGVRIGSFEDADLIEYKTFDGRHIPAWYYAARSCIHDCPAVIEVHGGPEDQMRPWFDSYAQFLVSHGVSVLEPNVRGSTGYGRTYLHLADVRKRLDSVKDVAAARSWLIDNGGADPKHVVVYGASYGGYMTLASLVAYPNDWAGGVDIYGPTNWVTFLEETAPYRRKNREAVYGSLDRDRAFLESISPINNVDAIKEPVLIFAGQNDPRVPVEQSQSFAAALESRHVPVDLVIFGNEGHSVTQRDNQILMYSRTNDFLKKYAGANL